MACGTVNSFHKTRRQPGKKDRDKTPKANADPRPAMDRERCFSSFTVRPIDDHFHCRVKKDGGFPRLEGWLCTP
jgi:hypothetical protein